MTWQELAYFAGGFIVGAGWMLLVIRHRLTSLAARGYINPGWRLSAKYGKGRQNDG